MTAASDVNAQWNALHNPFSTSGYGLTGGYGTSPYGYGVQTGRIGPGYQGATSLYNRAYQRASPGTTVAFQPLINAITLVPGWNGTPRRTHHRLSSVSRTPRVASIKTFDDDGKILWPSTIPTDAAAANLRQAAEEAVRTVVHESKSTGHASVRPEVDAKKKLAAFEHEVLPAVNAKNATDGAALEAFFFNLDQALDALTYVY
jgi:hypothetical protein